MSAIIELIITFVLYFLAGLAIALLITYINTREMDKLISDYFRTIEEGLAASIQSQDESRTEQNQSQDEVSAQMDEISESADRISESFDEIHEDMDEIDKSFDEINKSCDRMDESFDRMIESMDRTIEFKRLMADYSNYKIKMIEARENFREPEFSDEKNIH